MSNMIDREKVIAAGSCEKWGHQPSACKTCPFGYSEKLIINETEYYGCNREKWQHDALALLNEHERRWKELRECITEMSTNGGTGSQQDVCRYLAHLMDVIEGVKA